jgi:hypothetical protein
MTASWVRVLYRRGMNVGGIERPMKGYRACYRIYHPEGKRWPRLVVSVTISHRLELGEVAEVYVACKPSPLQWWCERTLPVALLGELREIVAEAESLATKPTTEAP